MKKILFSLVIASFSLSLTAQNVGINTSGAVPNASAALDVDYADKGLLIPRVTLQSTTDVTTIPTPATSLLVYNTNAAMTNGSVGYWHWDGAAWVRFATGVSTDWSLNGNAGTTAGTNFLGTTDAQDLVLSVNNTETMRLYSTGQVAVGIDPATLPYQELLFYAESQGDTDAVSGVNNANGFGVFGRSISVDGVFGLTVAPFGAGAGVWGYNINAGIGVWGDVDGPGIAVLGVSDDDNAWAVSGSNLGALGSGVVGSGNNTPFGPFTLGAGSGGAFTGEFYGVYGLALPSTATQANGTSFDFAGDFSAGGYFENWDQGLGYSWSAVACFASDILAGTDYKVIGSGIVSTIVKNTNNEEVVMFCPEAPEALFEDYGKGKLVNGFVKIELDPVFTKNITVNDKHELRVFIQLEGDCNGVFVTNKTKTNFEVKELASGKSNVNFTYHVIGNRADRYVDGQLISKFEDLRFPLAPVRPKRKAGDKTIDNKDHKKSKDKYLKRVLK